MGAVEIEGDVVRVIGPATIDVAVELRPVLLGTPRGARWTLDLAAAPRIDSAFVQLLVVCRRSSVAIEIVGLAAAEEQRWNRLGLVSHLPTS